MRLMDGRRAVVTGGASGIGQAICRVLAAAGARVAVMDRNCEGAEAMALEVGGLACPVDVADRPGIDDAMARAARELGGISTLVDNAGISVLGPIDRYCDDGWGSTAHSRRRQGSPGRVVAMRVS